MAVFREGETQPGWRLEGLVIYGGTQTTHGRNICFCGAELGRGGILFKMRILEMNQEMKPQGEVKDGAGGGGVTCERLMNGGELLQRATRDETVIKPCNRKSGFYWSS